MVSSSVVSVKSDRSNVCTGGDPEKGKGILDNPNLAGLSDGLEHSEEQIGEIDNSNVVQSLSRGREPFEAE
ncbi:hypothetical protein Dimus_015288, partial [Dionaea muscipula]